MHCEFILFCSVQLNPSLIMIVSSDVPVDCNVTSDGTARPCRGEVLNEVLSQRTSLETMSRFYNHLFLPILATKASRIVE